MVISSHKIMIAGEVLLKCCQTGSKIKSKLEDISHTSDMAPIEVKDLRKGFCVKLMANPILQNFLNLQVIFLAI